MGRPEGQSVGQSCLQCHAPAVGAGEIVSKEKGKGIPLVGWTWHPQVPDFLFSAHQGEGNPGICSRDELAKELEVDSGRIALGGVATGIHDAHIVDRVGDEVGERLIVSLCRETEGAVVHAERVVASNDEMDGALRANIFEEGDGGKAGTDDGVAQFLVEGGLIIVACCETEGPPVVEGGQ